MTVAARSMAWDVADDVYEVVPPAPPLRPFVENLWVHHVPAHSTDLRLLPDGRMNLIWTRTSGVMISGPQSRWFDRPVAAPTVAFGVRFWPGAAPTLLRVAAAELVDGRALLDDVDRTLADRIDRRLGEVEYDDQAFDVLNEELVRRLDLSRRVDPAVSEAVALLGEQRVAVAEVADRVYVSERQLQRRFVEHVGYGPKTLQRILRLQDVIDRLKEGTTIAAAAASAGYADQSHLFRESRRLAGLTPGALAEYRH
jgi:AraC-like DNA-binding protein